MSDEVEIPKVKGTFEFEDAPGVKITVEIAGKVEGLPKWVEVLLGLVKGG